MSRLKQCIVAISTVTTSVVAAAIIVEIGLRIAGLSYPLWIGLDLQLGASFRPGLSGRFSREGSAQVSINSDGFNAPNFKREKVENELRIAVIGDSFVAALQVDQDQHFSVFTREGVKRCLPNRYIAVLPFGVNGFNTVQQLLTYRHRVRGFKPDIVVLAPFAENDIPENTRRAFSIPYASHENGNLVIHVDHIQTPEFTALREDWERKARIINRFHVLQLLIEAKIYLDYFLNRPKDRRDGQGAIHSEADWHAMDLLIGQFAKEVRRDGAVPVTAPVHSAEPADLTGSSSLRDSKMLRQIAANHNMHFIDVLEPMSKLVRTSGMDFHRFEHKIEGGHYNVAGHREYGRLLGEALCGMLGK